jgi:hypothetical protein
MASLQCPSCGNRHPIDIVPDTETFACQQCRRLLKVPDALRHRRGDAIVTPHAGPNGDAGAGGRISTLSPSTDTAAPQPARAAAPAPAPVAASADRTGAPRSALAAAVEARSAGPAVGVARPAPADVPQEILAPPLSPQASAVLAAPSSARPGVADRADGAAIAVPVPSPAPAVVVAPSGGTSGGTSAGAGVGAAREPVGVHWTLRFLIWLAALGIAAIAVIVPYRRVGLIDFDGALKVIGGRGFEQWELPLIIVPPWAMGTALIAHFSIEGLARLRRRAHERERTAAAAVPETG